MPTCHSLSVVDCGHVSVERCAVSGDQPPFHSAAPERHGRDQQTNPTRGDAHVLNNSLGRSRNGVIIADSRSRPIGPIPVQSSPAQSRNDTPTTIYPRLNVSVHLQPREKKRTAKPTAKRIPKTRPTQNLNTPSHQSPISHPSSHTGRPRSPPCPSPSPAAQERAKSAHPTCPVPGGRERGSEATHHASWERNRAMVVRSQPCVSWSAGG